ncbi:hypothetical protein KEM52_000609 [Ascosphaera acerosa]|nr:hypothetical protein KEM52_000609 [Ascosphaera acerosa]
MTTRLYIRPLDPPLLEAILHRRPQPDTASYHAVPTFPENNYGFVDLPADEAEKIKKKLNGAILRGRKLKIHEAVPPRRPLPVPEGGHGVDARSSSSNASNVGGFSSDQKKRRARDNVLDGYELPSDRRVKRGWTEAVDLSRSRSRTHVNNGKEKPGKARTGPSDKKRAERSKYTEHSECLFATRLPACKMTATEAARKAVEKAKKKKSTKSRANPSVMVVHEFEQTVTFPSFIRSANQVSDDQLTSAFVEGEGWVDRRGHVKEPEPGSQYIKPHEIRSEKLGRDYAGHLQREVSEQVATRSSGKKAKTRRAMPTPPPDDETSSSGSSDEGSGSDSDSEIGSDGEHTDGPDLPAGAVDDVDSQDDPDSEPQVFERLTSVPSQHFCMEEAPVPSDETDFVAAEHDTTKIADAVEMAGLAGDNTTQAAQPAAIEINMPAPATGADSTATHNVGVADSDSFGGWDTEDEWMDQGAEGDADPEQDERMSNDLEAESSR